MKSPVPISSISHISLSRPSILVHALYNTPRTRRGPIRSPAQLHSRQLPLTYKSRPIRQAEVLRAAISPSPVIVAVALSVGIAVWGTNAWFGSHISPESLQSTQVNEISEDTMPTTLAPGRPGNLTAEQEVKLQQMWAIILDLLGVAHPEEDLRQNSVAASTNTGPADANDQAQKKKRFRLPLTGKNDHQLL